MFSKSNKLLNQVISTTKLIKLFNSGLASVQTDDSSKVLRVKWKHSDKLEESCFSYAWLRDNCPAPHTYNLTPQNKARKLLFRNLDIDLIPKKVEATQDGVSINWPDLLESSLYSTSWLFSHRLDSEQIRAQRQDVYLENCMKSWDKEIFTKVFRTFNWEELFQNGQHLLDALEYLNTWGLLVVDDVPCEKGEIVKFGDFLGHGVRQCHYGKTFQVTASDEPSNLAYTALELGFHTDLPLFDDMPKIQALHYIRVAGEQNGGRNTFVDVLQVANQIKADHPEAFRLLSTFPLEYADDILDQGRRYQQVARHPVFNFNQEGRFQFAAWNNPLRSWFYDGTPEEIQAIYEAMDTFRQYYSKPENIFSVMMKQGQLAIFDNLRIMHGREAYKVIAESNRYLEGTYYTWDSVRSKIRCLRRELGVKPEMMLI